MKIAIIGTGIAGNVAAHRLHPEHEISVYEANDYIGGHSHTHQVTVAGESFAVDSGFIVFNDRTYPHFSALLGELGVASRPAEMSFSVHCEATGFEYAGTNLNTLLARRRNLLNGDFYRLMRDILRFNRRAPALLDSGEETVTLGDYLRDEGYSQAFLRYYILPMGAAIWSTDMERMLDFPAAFFVRFFSNHGLLALKDRPRWYTVDGGSRRYVDKLVAPHRERIRLSSPVTRVRRFGDGVHVTSNGETEVHDAVFFACHSDQALAILGQDATPEEKAVLGAIPYQRNTAVLHTGDDRLPRSPRAWASWNYRLSARGDQRPAVTYYMNRLQSLPAPRPLCVTLNSDDCIPDREVLATMTYEHPLFTRRGVAAQLRQAEINGPRRSFFCGAWWRNGFHEDGVVSALDALEHFRQWHKQYEQQLSVRRAG